ncbi:ATP-dependent sacrificial sulfur transferase LarE [Acidobacteria bacterium AH-259-A15]|nr:ATP-dependent sacrificial sulfur transferase LarE [Acidobacteria bacterium AH-259-A15]
MTLEEKEQHLIEFVRNYESALIAFSGGVDSALLAFVTNRVLGERSLAVTAISPSVSELQREMAQDFAGKYKLNHRVIHTQEMEDPNYTSNPVNRCYFCKTELYTYLKRLREDWNLEVLFDGSNADDVGDYRPGRQAASEKGVVSPFIEVGINKAEIRALSRKWELPTWDQPAMPCLSSRFPYGVGITEEKLRQVDQAESFLRTLGLKNFRVRHHENLARIEVDRDEMTRILDPELFDKISHQFKSLGYQYVTLDLQGFRSGSLNEILKRRSQESEARSQNPEVRIQNPEDS